MTDLDPSERDELVSAYLDGEATAEEIARVESSPQLLARVEVLRSVTAMVAEPVPADPALREQQIAAALEASGTATNVTSLASKRKERNDRAWILSAAAVVVLLLIAIPIVRSGGGSDDDTAATDAFDTAAGDDSANDGLQATDDAGSSAAAEAAPEAELDADDGDAMDDTDMDDAATADAAMDEEAMADDGADDGADDDSADAGADTEDDAGEPEATPPAPAEAPRFAAAPADSVGELVAELEAAFASEQVVPAPEGELPCRSALDELIFGGDVVFEGESVVDGEPVVFSAYFDVGEGAPSILVLDRATCATLFPTELAN